MNKRKNHPRRHHASATPLVQVVELGPDFWCDDCGLLSFNDFSDFTEEGIEEGFARARRQFEDQYGHGLS